MATINTDNKLANKIAIIADTQLYKRLYGREETREDWYNAFTKAFTEITKRKNDIAAVLILGDVMDSNEVGSSAAFVLQDVLQKFSETNIPVGMILGNHDNERRSKYTWVEVCKLVNSHLIRLNPRVPMIVETGEKLIRIYGLDNGTRERISADLKELQRPEDIATGKQIENWLCLHQALKELAPYRFAWDVAAEQIPDWYNRVFLGDFHNTAVYTDITGREYIYPGAIETVSYNQTETPGFILFDTETNSWEHISTQQREYLTYDAEGKRAEAMLEEISAQVAKSMEKYQAKPVLRVLYTPENYGEYLKIADNLEAMVLKLFAIERGSEGLLDGNTRIFTGSISESGGIQTKEDILRALPELLKDLGINENIQEDIPKILLNPQAICGIKNERYPEAVYKKINF